MKKQKLLKKDIAFPAMVSISLRGPRNIVVNNEKTKTNPNVSYAGRR